MLRPPSNQKPYDEFYSGDPAFVQPPELPTGDDVEPAELERVTKARAEHAHKIVVARETGNWAELLIEGQTPTKFTMRPLPGDVYRSIVDLMIGGDVRTGASNHLLFRAAILGVTNLGTDLQVKQAPHENPAFRALGRIATVDVVNKLDAIELRIVNEIAKAVLDRSGKPSPK